MSKKIHTIQSSDKVEFDKEVNEFLELGGELMDGGYQVINNDDGVVYSQVIVFNNNCEVGFYENGRLKFITNKNEDGEEDGLHTSWYDNGEKRREETYKNGKEDGLQTDCYENGQKMTQGTWKDGKRDGLHTSWYDNGQKKFERIYMGGKLFNVIGRWYKDGIIRKGPFDWEYLLNK